MKKQFILIFLVTFSLIIGCSFNGQNNNIDGETFDTNNLHFKVVKLETSDEVNLKIIEITNETGFDLDDVTVEVSYPLQVNKQKELTTIKTIENFMIKSDETRELSVTLPIDKDLEDLKVDLKGNVKTNKNKKIPFQIVGALRALM